MPALAVYDAMVILQWAALPPQPARQHATILALIEGQLRLAMNQSLLEEIRGILFRPELRQKLPSLTPVRAAYIIKRMLEFSDWFENVP